MPRRSCCCVLTSLSVSSLRNKALLNFMAAAARMHAMDSRAGQFLYVSFLGELLVAISVPSDDGLLAGPSALGEEDA